VKSKPRASPRLALPAIARRSARTRHRLPAIAWRSRWTPARTAGGSLSTCAARRPGALATRHRSTPPTLRPPPSTYVEPSLDEGCEGSVGHRARDLQDDRRRRSLRPRDQYIGRGRRRCLLCICYRRAGARR